MTGDEQVHNATLGHRQECKFKRSCTVFLLGRGMSVRGGVNLLPPIPVSCSLVLIETVADSTKGALPIEFLHIGGREGGQISRRHTFHIHRLGQTAENSEQP